MITLTIIHSTTYLEIWKKRITLNDYINIRKQKYQYEINLIEQKIKGYDDTKSNATLNDVLQKINEIEKRELKAMIS
jgi:hypothetical protein